MSAPSPAIVLVQRGRLGKSCRVLSAETGDVLMLQGLGQGAAYGREALSAARAHAALDSWIKRHGMFVQDWRELSR